jgi:hypothetical protein
MQLMRSHYCAVCAGPLVLHVAKLFPKNDASSFDAYGRIFSGTLRPGDEVRGRQQPGFNNRRFIIALSGIVGSTASGIYLHGRWDSICACCHTCMLVAVFHDFCQWHCICCCRCQVRVLGEGFTPDDDEDSGDAVISNVWLYQARYRCA